MSELLVNTIKKADGTGSLSVPAESGTVVTTASPSLGRRNLIINGAMQVAQRGTSAVSVGSLTFLLDRWRAGKSGDGAFTIEQSTDAPANFQYSLKAVVTTADSSVAAGEYYSIQQRVEGYNSAHLNFGTADAQTVTLSFWVKSSITGTFSAGFNNSAYNRSYPFTYTISSADTWEQKTVTLTGDTTGTWLTTNGVGLQIIFDIGSGTDNTGTAGAWVGAGNAGVDGSTKLIETLNATWQITGVQLEVGSVATPFEHRSYGEELALCQRYFEKKGTRCLGTGVCESSLFIAHVEYSVTKRANPTFSYSASLNIEVWDGSSSYTATNLVIGSGVDIHAVQVRVSMTGLTAGKAGVLESANGEIYFDAEL